MIRNDPSLLCTEYTVFLRFTGNNHFHRFKKIRLWNCIPAVANCHKGSFVDNIGQIRTNRTACCQSNFPEINCFVHADILCMNFQNIDTSSQIRTLYNNPAVKTSRTKKCLIQNLRTVRRCKNNDALRRIKTIHLSQQLVQCLLTLVIATESWITALADGIQFIDKDNTRRILLCLLKKVSYSGSTDTHEHLYEIGTWKTEERHIGFTGNCLGKQCLTCSGRPHKKGTLRQFRTNLRILLRIMKKIYYLFQRLLRFLLTCHILECDACLVLYIELGIALADAHNTTAAFESVSVKNHHHCYHQNHRQHKGQNTAQYISCCVNNLTWICHTGIVQFFIHTFILNIACIILNILIILQFEINTVGIQLNLGDLTLLNILHKLSISHFLLRSGCDFAG